MRLLELHLKAFGPFTDHVLTLGSGSQRLVLVHGLNEAGKSSALRAIAGLRFGIPTRTEDRFVHDYAQMRIGGVFVDGQGQTHSLMRRKGTGVTLRFADFSNAGVELPDPVSPALTRLLTGGLSVGDYESMFSLDHQVLRRGGAALAKGEGETGAALFEASSGASDVQKILAELDASAKRFFIPAAHAKNGRINQALAEYKAQAEQYKSAQVKPARWEIVDRVSRLAHHALNDAKADCQSRRSDLALLNELMAVAPILAALAHAESVAEALCGQPLLAENAATERAGAAAGLSDATADMAVYARRVQSHREAIARLQLDPEVLAASAAVSRLGAAAGALQQLFEHIATADAEAASRAGALNDLSAQIMPGEVTRAVLDRVPAPAATAHISACVVKLEQAGRALEQHGVNKPDVSATASGAATAVTDAAAQADLRIVLSEINKNATAFDVFGRSPAAIQQAARAASSQLAEAGLSDEASARRVRPLMGAVIDAASQQATALASERIEKIRRIDDMTEALRHCENVLGDLLAQGHVPTYEDVRLARQHRETGWVLVRAIHIDAGAQPPTAGAIASYTKARALPESFEAAVREADSLMDSLARDTGRVTRLEAERREQDRLVRDVQRQQEEVAKLEVRQAALDAGWQAQLKSAGLPAMPPAQVRDWQALVLSALKAFDEIQALSHEQGRLRALEDGFSRKLRQALHRLGMQSVAGEASLATLVAMGEDSQRQIQQRAQDEAKAAGQALQLQKQLETYAAREQDLRRARDEARSQFSACLASLQLPADASLAMAQARLDEFSALRAAHASLQDIETRRASHAASLSIHQHVASNIAAALGEPTPVDLLMAAERWSSRLEKASRQHAQLMLSQQQIVASEQHVADVQSKALHHQATLARLRTAAGVETTAELPAAEELSAQKRQALRDGAAAASQLAQASNKSRETLEQLLAGRLQEALRADATRLSHAVEQSDERVEQARVTDEAARIELAGLNAQDKAASALEAMASAIATVRETLPLHIRTRLAHSLLQAAVERFKERSQAPMLKSASGFFTQMTGSEFVGLVNDDAQQPPVIAARRPGGALVGVDALSEGTRDQLFLALRLAALQLQRERGVDLPVVLDDVLMTSDDGRAGCVLQALCTFSEQGQVIVFTHHQHLIELARRVVPADVLAVVELKRQK